MIELHAWLDTVLEAGILWILIREYNFDKIAYEKEQYKKISKRKKSKGLDTAQIPSGSDKKDMAVEPSKAGSAQISSSGSKTVAVCQMRAGDYCDGLCDKERTETQTNAGGGRSYYTDRKSAT